LDAAAAPRRASARAPDDRGGGPLDLRLRLVGRLIDVLDHRGAVAAASVGSGGAFGSGHGASRMSDVVAGVGWSVTDDRVSASYALGREGGVGAVSMQRRCRAGGAGDERR
jgi:hypothetical protein